MSNTNLNNDDQLMQNVATGMSKYGLKKGLQVGMRLGRAAAKALWPAIKYIFALLAPYLIPILIVLAVFAFIYFSIFLVPKYITRHMNEQNHSSFTSVFGHSRFSNEWTLEKEQDLYDKYVSLCESWQDGLTDFQKEQASQYQLSWALLAAIDRVSSDYVISGQKGIHPQPEKNYAALKPRFEWQKYKQKHKTTYEYLKKEYARDENGKFLRDENGKLIVVSEEWVERENDSSEDIDLLKCADTFDNLFEYEYEELFIEIDQYHFLITNEFGETVYEKYIDDGKKVPYEYKQYENTMRSAKDTDRRRNCKIYLTKKEVLNIVSARLPLERLNNLLLSYNIDTDLERGFVIHLAQTYDENFVLSDFAFGDGDYEYGIYVPTNRKLYEDIPVINTDNLTRNDIVKISKSLLTIMDGGPLPYFWGGKYPKKGVNRRWGHVTQVTAAGCSMWPVGSRLPYGLDCSGFVDWVYVQATGKTISALAGGGGAAAQFYASKPISIDELKPGDLGFLQNPYRNGGKAAHVGIYIGDDVDGTPLFIHAAGSSFRIKNDPFYRAGRVLVSRLNGYYKGNPPINFKYFGRPPVKFKGE